MDQEKIGQLIKQKRLELGLTQQELADKLNITAKAISKWECGMGLPDITIIGELSKIFNITTDELLNAKLANNKPKKKKNRVVLAIIISIVIIAIIYLLTTKKTKEDNEKENCTVIRTYYIDNISDSNDENYMYITIHEFQVEGTFTIKIPTLDAKNLKVDNNYEFTFKTNDKYTNNSKTDILFQNSKIININYTDKIGLEQISKSYCDK